jgi:hypothetical protein
MLVFKEFDGDYKTNSKGHRREEQVKFRLLVYSKEKVRRKKKSLVYFARAVSRYQRGKRWICTIR